MNRYPLLLASPCRLARHGLLAIAGCVLVAPQANAASASEQAHIEVMIRQLNALEESARRSARIADEPGQRYFFDYRRLATDIQRIRQGLQDYLTPSRAQPRDPAELSGHYTLNGGRMP